MRTTKRDEWKEEMNQLTKGSVCQSEASQHGCDP